MAVDESIAFTYRDFLKHKIGFIKHNGEDCFIMDGDVLPLTIVDSRYFNRIYCFYKKYGAFSEQRHIGNI